MVIYSKILILAALASMVVVVSPFASNLFLAALSSANVYVPKAQENQPVEGGGGGNSYYPTAITTTVPPAQQPAVPVSEGPENVQENIPVQPAVSSVAQPENNAQEASASILPMAVADLSQKIPEFANILSNLNVKSSQDVANLQNYNIFLPGLASITGADFSNLTLDQKNKIPGDTMFVLLGNKSIDAPAKLNFSDSAPAPQEVSVLPSKPMYLVVKPSAMVKEVTGYVLFEASSLESSLQNFSVLKFKYNNNGDGIYTANISSPAVTGKYQIVTSIDYADAKLGQKDIKTTTLVDPDGYIYENVGNAELRISGAVVSLYKLNAANQYELWNSNEYGQENPQTTDTTGNYSFLVPVGTYYLTVSAPGYYSYKSDAVSVMEGKEIRNNIALKKQVSISDFINWNTVLMVILFCMVIYNFYMDMRRRKK